MTSVAIAPASDGEVEQLTAGIDWISATMHKGYDNAQVWYSDLHKAIEKVAKTGNTLTQRRLLGFEGVSCGNCFVGENETSYYTQFTGSYANDAYIAVIRPNAHISRIDVQFTVKFTEYKPNIGKGAYRAAIRENDNLPTGRKRKVWIIVGSDGGDTCYIGAPSSEQRGRIYNKERQSDDVTYIRSWRYECVYRNELATNYAQQLIRTPTDHAGYCLATVIEWFASRGVDCRGYSDCGAVALPLQRTMPTDVERRLNWLATQVRPAIRGLLELGFRDTIMEVLFGNEPN